MYAKIAAEYIATWCKARFENGQEMESTIAGGKMIDVFDHKGYGSHRYIPADRLATDLGLPARGGIYGYWLMADNSYLLLTCPGRLAFWSGKDADAAEWGNIDFDQI